MDGHQKSPLGGRVWKNDGEMMEKMESKSDTNRTVAGNGALPSILLKQVDR